MYIWHFLADYSWIPARGLSMAVPFFIMGRLHNVSNGKLSVGLVGTGYILVVTLTAILTRYSEAVLMILILLALVALSIGRYVKLSMKADRILLGAAFVAIMVEAITAEEFRLALGGELTITYNTLLTSVAFSLAPEWMRSYSVGVTSYLESPSVPSQLALSIVIMTLVFILTVFVLRLRAVTLDASYQWATLLALGVVFLAMPNSVLILGVVTLASYLGARCRDASVGLSYAWLFETSPGKRGFRLWLVIAMYVALYHLIYARAAIADFGGGPGSLVSMNWFAVCLGMSVLAVGVGMLLRALSAAHPLEAPKAFGVLQICIGVLGILAVSVEVSRAGIAIILSPDSLLLALVLVYAVPGLLAGIALVAEYSWARAIGIAVSLIDLLVMPFRPFPVGLLLGGLGIIVLGRRPKNRTLQEALNRRPTLPEADT